MAVTVRPAIKTDAQVIVDLIYDLAVYEKLEEYAVATRQNIEETLFNESPKAFALLAQVNDRIAGMALYFFNYSTFQGKHGIYLEDLFVKPEFRSQKIGLALFKALGQAAKENDCGRIDWSVLDWNQLAIDFYHKLGAKPQSGWTGYRLDGEALAALK
ncbi:GNAT family N-acetyltransferase [Kangiella sp. TOML190]|uniref:GNAT family N-acetyltransferase n=1 Tax=Kangiella sp. TOML190 TaxID=2931351 RepID=UPI00203F6783|nr:GNAT family N-acetyltransferase [Kangiella sp. TOML190]